MAHTCPTKGCERVVHDDTKLMCRTHWFELKPSERVQVYASYRMHGPGLEHMRMIQSILDAQAIRMDRGER